MGQDTASVDQLYLIAENLAQDFSLFPRKESASVLTGVFTEQQIEIRLDQLRNMDVDAYISETVAPVEAAGRPGARDVVRSLGVPLQREIENGPFYAAEFELDFDGEPRKIGLIGQDRRFANGVWGPEHHWQAARVASDFAIRSMPVVTFMDTPGADGSEHANANNQAHSISNLIAELCNLDVPTIGIIIGQGYSGGAIPLASTNLLLSTRTSVFNTIHPRGLASLVRRYNLSWQECAKFVGVSPCELYKQHNIDGIIDYDPGEEDTVDNLKNVVISGIQFIEDSARQFVREHPEIFEHYRRNINRYLNLSESLAAVHASSTLKLRTSPTEYPNIFGTAFRYQRYLGLRRRIKTTTTTRYGRLEAGEIPSGELQERLYRERRSAFLSWLQDPDKIIYEEQLNKAWKNFQDKREEVGNERGRIAQLIFGEPTRNFENARRELCLIAGLHLYNRWKGDARDNLISLIKYLNDYESNAYLLQVQDVKDVKSLLRAMANADEPFVDYLRETFSFEGKKLFDEDYVEEKSDAALTAELVSELNLILENEPLKEKAPINEKNVSDRTRALIEADDDNPIRLNRRLLEDSLWSYIEQKSDTPADKDEQELTVLDVILKPEVREHFVKECQNLITFSVVYDNLVADLVSVARQAHESRTLPAEFIDRLIERSVAQVADLAVFDDEDQQQVREQFAGWIQRLGSHSRCAPFLKSVEEWIRIVHPDKSDALFVVVSFFFEKLLPEYYTSKRTGKRYEGKIAPVRIGRRKDFWNRLTIAYRDLLFHEILTREKRSKRTHLDTFLERFVDNFEELSPTLMSSDPVSFPTFRPSIEAAFKNGVRPCGLVTGLGDFKTDNGCYRVGLVISNLDFQVGCIDNSDCERFCKLLVECAIQRLPVICFVSSGGMQTKEGAASLFSMPVINDRITRFVRDNDLPVIMFGFGDCTGGAQASFVTHPLVQTYYFTGTSMPFAGQAVVESNLPFTCLLSNYLSLKPGAMRGLVKHPFAADLDQELRRVDPAIPLPTETVEQVVDRIMSGVLTAAEPVVAKEATRESDLFRPVRRTLIHARGCTAVKLVTKAQEHGLEVVLVQSDPDMDSVPADLVRGSDKHSLVCIGGNTSDESYLNALSVIRIAEAEQVDSLHPGIGFLSEDPNFAELVREHRINFIGPKVSSMETMGNKSNAIKTTMGLDVPVVPGSHGIVTNSERAAEICGRIGYPVLLKAVHGGGGKGIQVVRKPEELHRLFQHVTTEAKSAFGNGDVYIEKFVTSLRHIEVQVLRDTHGNTQVLGIRDCSVQRNNQKLMEESGSTILPESLKQSVCDYARKIADGVDYVGAGTVEFIYDVPNEAVYFMEMNTRLQVEHPVTEVVTGVDIVKQQFEIASGNSIAGLEFAEKGYALEVRINAEKAVLDANGKVSFVPTPGEITDCVLPEEPHIQLISMAGEGKMVSPFYDSMIVQVICWGPDRVEAINKMREYLGKVTIHGICTNIALIKRILQDEQFIEGDYDTDFLPQFLERIDANELIDDIEAASGTTSQGFDIESLRIEGSDELKVLSPSTGVFYRTPSPSEPEYVSVGDVVTTSDTLCQLEAMKIFTPVNLNSFAGEDGELYSSDVRYEITRINLASGQAVNEGDLLFVIKPLVEEEQQAA